jgi:uncharacterized membrane protein YtjA (UPF0391 family)
MTPPPDRAGYYGFYGLLAAARDIAIIIFVILWAVHYL